MKKQGIFYFALVPFVMMGCVKEGFHQQNLDDNILKISPSLEGESRSSDAFKGNDLSLSINYGDGDTYNVTNVEWTKGDGGSWTSSKKVFVKNETATAKVCAYSPYIESATTDQEHVEFSIESDQSEEENFNKSDLLAYVNDSYEISSSTMSIPFKHRYSLVDMTIDVVGNEAQTPSEVKFKAKNSVSFNALNYSEVELEATAEEITPLTVADGNHYQVILPPQTINGEDFVTLKIGETPYTYKPGNNLTLEPGKKLTLKLNVGKYGITVESINTEDWGQTTLALGPIGNWTDYASASEPAKDDEGYYKIYSAEELAYIAKNKNNTKLKIKLYDDIDLSSHYWDIPLQFIGTNISSGDARSELSGQNHKIIGMNQKNLYNCGLIGTSHTLIVKDVLIEEPVIIREGTSQGGFVGCLLSNFAGNPNIYIFNVHVRNAYIKVNTKNTCGGIIGKMNGYGALTASSFDGVIDIPEGVTDVTCGTLVGQTGIQNAVAMCYSSGELNIEANTSGTVSAFVGKYDLSTLQNVYVEGCYSTAKLNGVTAFIQGDGSNLDILFDQWNVLGTPDWGDCSQVNNYLGKFYAGLPMVGTSGAPKLWIHNFSDKYKYIPNPDQSTSEKFPYVLEKR